MASAPASAQPVNCAALRGSAREHVAFDAGCVEHLMDLGDRVHAVVALRRRAGRRARTTVDAPAFAASSACAALKTSVAATRTPSARSRCIARDRVLDERNLHDDLSRRASRARAHRDRCRPRGRRRPCTATGNAADATDVREQLVRAARAGPAPSGSDGVVSTPSMQAVRVRPRECRRASPSR